MTWPAPQEYAESVQNPRRCFEDPELRDSRPALNSLGLPRPITGNFASVYRMSGGGKSHAVRCFFRSFVDMGDRYAAISAHLAAARLPYAVGFRYLGGGIAVRGARYPILKMEWAEGKLLDEYVRQCLGDQKALRQLASTWLTLASDLAAAGVGHGDLQHGNVLCFNGRLRLVDYDGMFVPALRGRNSHELGHPNFQHPARSEHDFDHTMDHFSEWVIYASIIALAADPDLWTELGGGDERLLFGRGDFLSPSTSPAFRLLTTHPDEDVRAAAETLVAALDSKPDRVPALDGAIPGRSRRRGRRKARGRPITPSALPAWLAGWNTALQARAFEDPGSAPRLWLAVSSGLLTVDLLPVLGRALSATVRTEVAGAIVASWLVTVGGTYARDRGVRLRWRLLYHRATLDLRLRAADRRLEQAARRSERYEAWLVDFRFALGERLARAAREHDDRRSAVHEQTRAVLATLMKRRDDLCGEREQALIDALNRYRDRIERADLGRHRLRAAPIPGIGVGVKARLWAWGIRSAADIGSRASVLGRLSPAQSAALLAWREASRTNLPPALPEVERVLVEQRFARRLETVERLQKQTLLDATPLMSALTNWREGHLAELRGRERAFERGAVETRSHNDAHIRRQRARLEKLGARLERLEQALAPYERLTLGRFVALLLVGRRAWPFHV